MSDLSKTMEANRQLAERLFGGNTTPDDFAEDAVVWHSHDQIVVPRAENDARVRASDRNPADFIKDLRIFPHADGFAAQYRFSLPEVDGGLPAALFVTVVEGRITRSDEYVNPPARPAH